ncbi:ADP-ribose glycohydrolase MACROD1-like, partial [Diadema antillarum]|uniref:ADP-ribose glycohydrolase MACROD1-like n=1 Tax=Diadema antillarum TaxID=105358 RepID=UPI003A83F628
DGAIHRAAGSHLVQECRTVAPCDTGEAKLTAGYLLPARYVLHTVGPIVNGPTASANHRESLTSCYVTCLQRILEHNKSNRAKLEARKKKEAKDKSSGGGEDAGRGDSSANGKPAVEEDRGGSDILRLLRHDLEMMEPLIRSVAFPCISTGVYGYPQEDACQVALSVIREWLEDNPNELDRVVFCVFLERDLKIYERLLPSFFPLEGMSLASRNEDDDET